MYHVDLVACIEESCLACIYVIWPSCVILIHFKYSSICMSIPNSLTVPDPHPPCWQSYVHSLSPSESLCFVNMFICIILFLILHIRCHKTFLLLCLMFFSFLLINLFYFTRLYWFCHTLTIICHECTCIPHPESPPHPPPHPIPQGHPSVPTPSTLYHASNLD